MHARGEFCITAAVAVAIFSATINGAIMRLQRHVLHDDVRSHGSGNAGLTNFIRSYGAGRCR